MAICFRRWPDVAGLLLLLAFPAVGHAQTPAPTPRIEKVVLADDVYLFRAPSAMDMWTASNSVVIVNEQDVAIFDSNTRPATTALVLAEIRKITNKPVRYLINSHWHMDHWLGNEVYAKAFPGLQIIATQETRDYMKRMSVPYFVNMVGAVRMRANLDTAIRTGKMKDGSPFTAETRKTMESDLAEVTTFANEIAAVKQFLPTLAYNDSLTFWSGKREFRLLSMTGDATGSTVLYLPGERILVTGDVVVRRENGDGAQPWTTNSYLITPWLASLRHLESLDVTTIVPGQGPALKDKTFLRMTIELYEAIIAQAHAAAEGGAITLADVQAKVNLKDLRTRFTHGDAYLEARFDEVVSGLVKKVYQESHDGLAGASL